jgi:hypothetical protein
MITQGVTIPKAEILPTIATAAKALGAYAAAVAAAVSLRRVMAPNATPDMPGSKPKCRNQLCRQYRRYQGWITYRIFRTFRESGFF